MATARPAPAFTLDACLDAPAHVPGWMLEQGASNGPTIDPVPLPNHVGFVTTADASGYEPTLAAHYRRIPDAAPPPTRWRPDVARFSCFDVDLVIGIAQEHPLRIEMFGAAILAATELLGQLADAASPAGVLYDNLDHGWALCMNAVGSDVFTLEWDWERPVDQDELRALQRLGHLHGALVQATGIDLWNLPPRRA